MKTKVCLFSAHSPAVGGGGAILRSLTADLPDLDIKWYYVSDKVADGYAQGYLGKPVMGGPIVEDILETRRMLKGGRVDRIDQIVSALLATEADAYWIISHNEGLRIAAELATRQKQRPVHVTVHDDWAGALCARSTRYRFLAKAANALTIKTLGLADHFDVISYGMQAYYEKLAGKKGEVCHRFIAADTLIRAEAPAMSNEVTAGHIGSVYNIDDLFDFARLAKMQLAEEGKAFTLKMWGCHISSADVPRDLANHITFYDTLPEAQVIPQLSGCHFVYAMYPMKKALRIFSQTSLPTKLSSYVRAGRPIFGHGPADSTLAEFISATGLGSMWAAASHKQGADALKTVINMELPADRWAAARNRYFGEHNLEVIRAAFIKDRI